MFDVNIYQENLFHTKMMLKESDLDDYLFKVDKKDLSDADQDNIEDIIRYEIEEIFNGKEIIRK